MGSKEIIKNVLSYNFSELLIQHPIPESGPAKNIILESLLNNRVLIYRVSTVNEKKKTKENLAYNFNFKPIDY